MKTSLVIPAIPKHFSNITKILEAYLAGTELPDEVVISLSEAFQIKKRTKDNIRALYEKVFDRFLLIESDEKIFAGPNRQSGSDQSSHPIIIYQDADDIPHPQRIEVIKYFFAKQDIVHLNHSYIPSYEQFSFLDPTKIEAITSNDLTTNYFPNGRLMDCLSVTHAYGTPYGLITAGAVSIRREVLEKVKWRSPSELQMLKGEDYEFCMMVLFSFNKSIIIQAPIYKYLNERWEAKYIGQSKTKLNTLSRFKSKILNRLKRMEL